MQYLNMKLKSLGIFQASANGAWSVTYNYPNLNVKSLAKVLIVNSQKGIQVYEDGNDYEIMQVDMIIVRLYPQGTHCCLA